jgi:hypothetical protein
MFSNGKNCIQVAGDLDVVCVCVCVYTTTQKENKCEAYVLTKLYFPAQAWGQRLNKWSRLFEPVAETNFITSH